MHVDMYHGSNGAYVSRCKDARTYQLNNLPAEYATVRDDR